ncbi:MAG TPA: FAD-binding protein, partial [Thermoanaerobaculia bacterium]
MARSDSDLPLRERVPLAPLTTLGLGGPARYFLEARDDATLAAALRWAREEGTAATVLGGGSNVVVADAGVDGLAVRMAQRGVERHSGDRAREELWTVAAGEPWDALVERAVAAGLAGIECLSGIPGTAGATPIQNVGAYGQEVAEVVESVRVLDRATFEVREMPPEECAFAYRDSLFRRRPERFAVLAVTLRLTRGAEPAVRYP